MDRRLFLLLLFAGMATSTYPPDLKKLCTDEQAELEYERLKFYELTQCLAGELNASAFRQEILLAGDTQKVDAVISKVCKHLPQIMECTGQYVSSIGPCMDEVQRREKELWRNLRIMNMEFACGEGRNDLVRFIDEGGIPCVATLRANISACVEERFPDLLRQQSDTQIVKVLATITQQDDRCTNLNAVEACINKTLIQCMPREALGIIGQYFSSLDVLFTCANITATVPPPLPELQPSEYGPPSAATVSRMQDDGVAALSQLKQLVEALAAEETLRAAADAEAQHRLADVLRAQTRAAEQMAEALVLRAQKRKEHRPKKQTP